MTTNLSYILLAALVVAAAALVVDTAVTRRRRRRPPVDLSALLSTAVAAPSASRTDIWSELESSPRSGSASVDVWGDLDARLDPSTFRPKLAPGTEWKLFRLRWGNDYVMVANPDHDVHFELEPWVAELFPLRVGELRTVFAHSHLQQFLGAIDGQIF